MYSPLKYLGYRTINMYFTFYFFFTIKSLKKKKKKKRIMCDTCSERSVFEQFKTVVFYWRERLCSNFNIARLFSPQNTTDISATEHEH